MRTLIILIFSTLVFSASAQNKTWDSVLEKLDHQSLTYLNSYIQGSWETYISQTHPNIVEMAGNKEVLIRLAEETITMYKSLGYELNSGQVTGDIQTVDSENGIQAIVPASLVMTADGKTDLLSPIKLFAISEDAGETWKFVDLSQYDSTSIEKFVPEFDKRLMPHW